ncbi:hypothetical protein [Actinomyces ruminicola]|uniref:Lantibiotic dehydratase, C terminus n=1 Tax=Actinomyces ruminicola TaxID=332524 RepID=A0A1G9YYG2_9ACTO|nr:hypothetical protein [Actinomyces ruminicola]SDN14212.1 hypothetical protein SAMN04487766_1157 [Actinomyces ruminicola]
MNATLTASRTVVSPTVFARIGGLPADAVPGASTAVTDCLDRLHDAEERLEALTQPLIDQIFELVPDIEDSKVRRLVLQAKREVFARRVVAGRAERALCAVAPSGLLAAFEEWREQIDRRDALDASLSEVLAADDAEMLQALDRTVSDPGYLASLALATPELVARLLDRRPSKAPSERLVRSLYNYATRAALKTSPFSGLTTVNIAGADGRGRSTRTVAVHLASGLLRRAAHDGAHHPGLVLESSPVGNLPAEEHDRLVMLAQYVHQDGIIFREELVTGAEWAPTDYPDTFVPGVATDRVRRHLDAGALRERVPWSRGDAPLAVMSSVFPEGIGGVGADDMLGAGATGRDCKAADAAVRVRSMQRLTEFSSRVFDRGELGRCPGGLLYEDREAPWAVPDVLSAPGFREDLEDLSELMSPWVFRSHAYDLMVERFVARYGVGGRCDSPLSFCMALAVDNDGDRELSAAFIRNQRADVEQAAARSKLACGATAAPRHLGVMLQPVASSWEGLNGGEHLMVLNNTGSGIGAYQARFHRLFGETFRQDLEAEISGLWPGRKVLELTAWADCNTGQAMCTGVLPELQLPGEPKSPRGVPLESLSLIHDPMTDSLELWDDDGPVGLAYLGLTPQHLLNTYLHWVALLADPWVRFPPHTEAYAALTSGYKRLAEGAIEHEPRRMAGRRLVTRRESWLLSAPTLLDAVRDGEGLSVRRIDELRRRQHMPRQVFIQQLAAGGGTTNDRRKPQFVDLASRTSLSSLGHWLDSGANMVRITEALPGAGEHPHHDPAGRPRVSELAVSLRWPRQEAR